jgi:DNA polymerase-3 subunit alpha
MFCKLVGTSVKSYFQLFTLFQCGIFCPRDRIGEDNMTNNNKQPVDPFVHLHSHSTYSLLDGFSTIPELLDEVQRLGQPAVSVTDHGNLHAAYEFYKEATSRGIKPIIGLEAYVAPSIGSHKDHIPLYFAGGVPGDVSSKGSYTHMLLFAENNVGLKNLFKLNTLSYTEGYYRKNRISIDLLEEYHEGLIGTTGCPSGEIQTRLRLGQYDEALAFAARMQNIFGKDNYFLELMEHGMSIDLERKVLAPLMEIAKTLDIPLLATNDNHYTKSSEANAHEHMLCISTHSQMSVPTSREEGEGGKTRFAFDGNGYYVKSYQEMAQIFPEDKFPGALSNTVKIAERCNVTMAPDNSLRPALDLPAGHTEESYLREQAYAGMEKRVGALAHTQEYIDRMETELGVIIPKDYSNYFLVVSDFVRWGKFIAEPPVPTGFGRGSAAGSLLAFSLDITDADPIKHGLLFERFLNPERDSPPDIDMDFNDVDRDRVIQYVKNKYGNDHVSYVVTFGKILAKNAVKDTIRILGEPYSLGDELTKSMPEPVFGKTMPLKYMYQPGAPRYDEADGFRNLVKERNAGHVVDIAKQLEGRVRSTGVHAAAVIISSKPVWETVPQMMRQSDDAMITQWDYPTCEEIGLLKVDFLGLRNLGIMRDAIANIKKTRGIEIDIQDLIQGDMDDPATYELLQAANTVGVFQVEGGGMRALLKILKATHFGDISALLSLYRPGPMGVDAHINYALRKNGLQEVDYIHPELTKVLEPILGPTYGLVIYQEQVQLIAREMSGYSLGEADNLRRAMGKKKKEVLEKEYIPFRDGAVRNGYSEEAIKAIWDVLVPFADYAFNKSHTVGYGLITYVTAYLKANYPAEYIAALLSSVSDDTDKTAMYLEDARLNGIKVLPPDVSRSEVDYTPISETEILFGLKAIRGIGEAVSEEIVSVRTEQGNFNTFDDFLQRVPRTLVNKRILEGLTYGGAFDKLGTSRRALIYQIPELVKQYQKASKSKSSTQMSLFDIDDIIEYKVLPMDEYPKMEKLTLERKALGLYVSAHPIDGLNISNMATVKISNLNDETVPALEGWPDRNAVPYRIAGILTSLAVKRTKKGENFAIAKLEDRSGSIECAIFPKSYRLVEDLLKLDGVYQFVGFSRKRDEEISFTVDNVRPLEFSASGNLSVRLKVTELQWARAKEDIFRRMKRHVPPIGEPGDNVIVSIKSTEGAIREETLDVMVKRSPALIQEMQELLGAICIGRWRTAKKPAVTSEEETPENEA